MAKKQFEVPEYENACTVNPRRSRRPKTDTEPGVKNILFPWFTTGQELTLVGCDNGELEIGGDNDTELYDFSWKDSEDVIQGEHLLEMYEFVSDSADDIDNELAPAPLELDVLDRFYAGTADTFDSIVAMSRIAGLDIGDVVDQLLAKGVDLLRPMVEDEEDDSDPITAVDFLTNRELRGVSSLPGRRFIYANA